MITIKLENISRYQDIIKVVNDGGQGYVAVIKENKTLVGLVTDGDIRRCLLEDTLSIESLINTSPLTCSSTESEDYVRQQLNKKSLKQMLLVNEKNQLVNIISVDENIFAKHNNKVVIMAGGLGSRLGDLTKSTPKPMLLVANKPIILHIIERFRSYGFRDFIISTNYKKDVIEGFLGNGHDFGVNIEYVNENKRMGTAGALSFMKGKFDAPFFVTNADVISMIDYQDLLMSHLNSSYCATMCVRQHDITIPFGVIESNESGRITDIFEKPTHSFDINAGIYVLSPEVLTHVPDNQFYDMPTLFLEMSRNGIKSQKYELNNYWIDIGNPDDFKVANEKASEYL